jgi:hypothetical protein
MQSPNDTIGNRIIDLLACSAVTLPTAPPRTPMCMCILVFLLMTQCGVIILDLQRKQSPPSSTLKEAIGSSETSVTK